MLKLRVIPCLDVKDGRVVKGINFISLRDAGDPVEQAALYDAAGADELCFLDITASHENRDTILDVVSRTAARVFLPLTVGGGIRSIEDARLILRAGADKVAINTAACKRPRLISEMAERFGSQCMVLSIEAKRDGRGGWEAYTDNGREHTGRAVAHWAAEGAALGAGEILLTSVDQEGTRRGFDCALIEAVAGAVDIPVIASGGMGSAQDVAKAAAVGADAVAFADILHYGRSDIAAIRAHARGAGLDVREV